MGGSAGGGRLNSGWGGLGGGPGMGGHRSGEGAGWRTGATTTTTTSITTMSNSPSFDRRSSESAAQLFKSRPAGTGAGYVPSNANGHSTLLQQQQQQPMVSPGFRRNQPLQQRTGSGGGDGTGTGAGGGASSLEMSWMNSGEAHGYSYNNRNNHSDEDDDDEDDYYKDNKKDRSFYTRREHHSQPRKSRFPLLFSDPKRVLRARLFCLRQNRRLHPLVRLVVFLFLAGSVCFTTIHLLFLGTEPGGPGGLVKAAELKKSFDLTDKQLRVRLSRSNKGTSRVLSPFDVEAQNYSNHQWTVDTYDIRNSRAIARVGEDYMLSKAFNGAMQPTRVIPFYFKASFRDEDDDDDQHIDDQLDSQGSNSDTGPDSEARGSQEPVKLDSSLVTITTLITPNRYGVFLKLVKQYRGPISVATHIRKGPEQDAMFHELHAFFRDNAILRKYVDLHVIVDGIDFQLNMWRNVARMFARTDYFMMLDVDFHIPSSLKKNLHYDPRIQQLLASGAALVVPAFEYKEDQDPKDSKYFPETKAELLPLLEKGHIHVFHDSFPPGHGATDTPRWVKMSQGISGRSTKGRVLSPKGRVGFEEDYSAAAAAAAAVAEDDEVDELQAREEYLEHEADGERPYKVTKFEPKYEPYVILKKEGTPWCDERFVGYGANKAACLFEIYISGIDFWVMPQDFLIHQYHDYPTTDRKNGRILNRQLFVSFQQEICFRTLDRMIITGEWYTSKADNLRHQCSDFEGFLQSADQLAREFEERHPDSLLKDPVFVTEAEEAEASRPRLHVGVGNKNGHAGGGGGGGGSGTSAGRQEQVKVEGEEGEEGEEGTNHSHEHGSEITFGKQLVDGEQYQDPWMSRPQGKIWGGVQPRTFYVPPPSEEEELAIPIDGIGLEAALEGTNQEDHDKSPFSFEEAEKANSDPNANSGGDLTGERLERFREGIILPPAHNLNHEGQQGRSDHEDEDGEAAAEADGSVAHDNSGDSGDIKDSPASSPQGAKGGGGGGGGSFMDEAEKLEEKFRFFHRN
ncbi:hypothetical protein BGZ95_009815 [Linnemannia exigua]|uniref:Glycosyltransferase family 49 protein n=1 Tax=Linnemannia exigua TaxID=604196 RepID=A0AAD4DC55_9FUNG|nr:hypothetical protein BGZ95_009815 [Linnemannia exigua]